MTNVLLLVTLLLVLVFIGSPIYVVFGIGSMLMILFLGYDPCLIVPTIFANLNSFVLMAIPFFILAGNFMTVSGISDRLTEFSDIFVGKFRGGLGLVVIISSGMFGAISGSSASTIATIGAVALPQMEKDGYTKEYATALIACSGTIGQLIPPSIPMILFGMVTKTSIVGCFLATAIPGILVIIAYSVVNFFHCRKNTKIRINLTLVESNSFSINKFFSSIKRFFWAIFLPVLMIGGIYSGLFTPTEAGCVAVAYSILVSITNQSFNMQKFWFAVEEAISITGTVFLVIAFITVIGRILTYERISELIAMYILGFTNNKICLLLLINLFVLLMGMIMDDISGMLIMAPLLCPLFSKLGVEPLQVAAILAVNQGSGQITPPVATNLFTASRLSGISVFSVFKYCLPFLLFGSLPVLLLVTFVPWVSLWLPQLIMK